MLRPDVFWHLIWPTLLAVVFWSVVGIYLWAEAAAAILRLMQGWPVVGGWLSDGDTVRAGAAFVINMALFFLSVPLVFVTASVIVAVFAIPLILERVAKTDYADLARYQAGSNLGSALNAGWAFCLFLVLLLISLPLWLIPGVGIFLSVGLSAWMNKRCYGYDALMSHADLVEMREVPAENSASLYLLGMFAGALMFVPILNLFVPAITGLVFVHFLLEALRLRRGARPV